MSDAQYREGGGDLPAYQEDFFQRIVNVSWAGKLAVDLPSHTYLQHSGTSPTIIDMTTVTISLWFRFSQALMNSTWQTWIDGVNANTLDNILGGLIPLLVWGETSTITQQFTPNPPRTFTAGPSFIGAYVGGSYSSPTDFPPNLVIRLQSQSASTLNYYSGASDEAGTIVGTQQEPNYYAVGPQDAISEYSASGVQTIDISPDVWHHMIVSYSVHGSNGKLWVALDDQNKSGKYFYPAATFNMDLFGVTTGGPNDITATYDWPIFYMPLGVGPGESLEQAISGGFSMANSPELAIPIRSSLIGYAAQPIEVAELQIFNGKTLDTSSTANRRLFIDAKGKPAKPSTASDVLGKPAVLLHTLPKWQKGSNSGTAGPFDVTGKPKKFEPEPELGK